MPLLRRLLLYSDVIPRLGFHNIAYVAWYRFTLKSGLRKPLFPQRSFATAGPFFKPVDPARNYPDSWKTGLIRDADRILQGCLRYYAHHWKFVGNPPNWFLNPFNDKVWPNPGQHWTTLEDFPDDLGDIKHFWDASRFEWVVTLARAHAVTGNRVYLDTLNRWLGDWAIKNPVNTGPNWKCGQEAAIRIFNLMLAACILKQWQKPGPALREFVYRHLERISSNIRYAAAQDNNHGTSEAAALFIGGLWLAKSDSGSLETLDSRLRGNDRAGSGNDRAGSGNDRVGSGNDRAGSGNDRAGSGNEEGGSESDEEGSRNDRGKRHGHFVRQGRKWLEDRVRKLVAEDGSFSQHSVTYHRVLLDTLSFVEFWRRQFSADPFSDMFYRRARAAINWMYAMMDIRSGNAPNLGANDGAMFLNAHGCDYRDFRPSIQTASVLFHDRRCLDAGPWDEPGYWLGLDGVAASDAPTSQDECKKSQVLPGGYVIMAGTESWGLLRFPIYRFRPGENDVFHFDLWWRGINILRDAGSFSYHPENIEEGKYFVSVKAHNTVGFDNGEQMPRLGRFLLGKWITADHVGAIEQHEGGRQSWRGAYHDWRGNRHQRSISWHEDEWVIEDRFEGNFEQAEIRYHLIPDAYRLDAGTLEASWGRIEISGEDFGTKLIDGVESLYYQQKQRLDTLIINPAKGCNKITTRIVHGNTAAN